MTNFAPNAGRYFLFLAIILCVNLAVSVYFRSLAFLASSQEQAESLAGPSTGVFMLFGGFLIARPQIRGWFIWLYWLSPYSWAGRSAATNEFKDSRFDLTLPNGERQGDSFLLSFGMYNSSNWIWAGILYQLGFYFLFAFISAVMLRYRKVELSRGTKRPDEEDNNEDKRLLQRQDSEQPKVSVENPVTIAFKDLSFTVGKVGTDKEKTLLRKINGFAKPGTLTALMGASGAGKTTLMDVLAGRKTQGLIEGTILVNGEPKNDASFNRVAGYVEQMDAHIPNATVYESLMFSAKLRLPSSVPSAKRKEIVEKVMMLLELDDIRDRAVGEADELGLSPGQLKRLTIGVELVTLPSVLFLDEPTTGLDSRTALSIIRVIRKVAQTGRAVVCTIHQPSAEVFYQFDRLLLLQSGGFQVFFGELGPKARYLEDYLSALPGVTPRPPEVNPASWMLDVIGAGTSLGKATKAVNQIQHQDGQVQNQEDQLAVVVEPVPEAEANGNGGNNHNKNRTERFNELYKQSQLAKRNELEIEEACQLQPGAKLVENRGYARPLWVQYEAVQIRAFRSHWRDIPFNFTRFMMSIIMPLIFGLVWFRIDADDQISLNSKMSAMFMSSAFGAISNCGPQMHSIARQRPTIYRERFSRAYSPVVYSTALAIVELPFVIVNSIAFVSIFYFLAGFESSASSFFRYLLAHFMLSLCFDYVAQLLVMLFPTIIFAQIFQGTVFTFIFLFGGIFIPGPSIPEAWHWVHEIDPIKYSLQMMFITQFSCEDGTCPSIPFLSGTETVSLTARQFLESSYGIDFGGYWWTGFGALVIYAAVVRVLIALTVQFVVHIKR